MQSPQHERDRRQRSRCSDAAAFHGCLRHADTEERFSSSLYLLARLLRNFCHCTEMNVTLRLLRKCILLEDLRFYRYLLY